MGAPIPRSLAPSALLVASLLLLGLVAAGVGALDPQQRGLEPLLPQLPLRANVSSALELLSALNSTEGSDQGELITLTGESRAGAAQLRLRPSALPLHPPHARPSRPAPASTCWLLLSLRKACPLKLASSAESVFIRPQDVRAFQPWLPLDGGNRTVVLHGSGPPGGGGGARTVLDWGGAVNLLYHPAGHTFLSFELEQQGMAPPSSGYAAGLTSQARPCMCAAAAGGAGASD